MKYEFFHFAILVSINLFVMLCVSICINVDEGASYLTLFCYRPVSLVQSYNGVKLYLKEHSFFIQLRFYDF